MYADARFWDGVAESYAAQPVENPDAFDRKIAINLALMAPDHVVADFGCGTGSLVLRLAPSGAQVHGIDLSPEMIRIARGKAEAGSFDNVHFHVGSIEDNATFGPEGLDGALTYSLLHLVEDRKSVLAKLYRLLKPGGYFVSSTVCLGDSWVPFGPMLTVMRWLGRAPSVSQLSRRVLVDEIAQAGFIDIETPDVGAKSIVSFVVARKPA